MGRCYMQGVGSKRIRVGTMTGSERAILTETEREILQRKAQGKSPDRVYNVRYILRKRIPNLAQDLEILRRSGEDDLVKELSEELGDNLSPPSDIEARIKDIENRLEELEETSKEITELRTDLEEVKSLME